MKVKTLIISIGSILVVSLFPSFFMYFNNLGKAQIKEVAGISAILVLLGFILLAGNLLLLKNISKATLMTNIVLCVILYFALIERTIHRVFPMAYYWHVVLLCVFLLAHALYLTHNKISSTSAFQINQGILIIFGGLILFNGIVKVPPALKEAALERQTNRQNQLVQKDMSIVPAGKEFPNVYYFIFDEYAGFDSISRYCDYDNSEFYNSLEDLGFVTSKHSVNGSVDTLTEIPNLLQLQGINSEEMPDNDKKKYFKNPYLFKLMKENGFSINLLDTTNYKFLDDSYADYKFTDNFESTYRTFSSYIINNTLFYPFYGNKDQDNEIKLITNMFDYARKSSSFKDANLFTMGYFDFPHIPYIVDEDGNKASASDRTNLRDPAPYCRQFIYANKKILEMVHGIIENDPESIVILQSDHGFRLPSHLHFWYDIYTYDLEVEAKFERNILNAVYYRGEQVEIEGLSGLNTLYVVLNRLLGTDFEYPK